MGASEGLAALALLCFAGTSIWLVIWDLRYRILPNRIVIPGLVATLALLVLSALAHGLSSGEWFQAPGPLGHPDPCAGSVGAAFWPAPIPAVSWLAETLGGAAAAFGVGAALWLAVPGGFGGGDVKAAPLAGGVLGFVGGWPGVLVGFLAAAIIAGLWGTFLVLRRRSGGGGGARSGSGASPSSGRRSGRGFGRGFGSRIERVDRLPFAPALFAGSWIVLVSDAALAALGAAAG